MNGKLALRPYSDVRELIEDGSLLLFRGSGLVSEAIQTAGRSPYSHAAMAVWARRYQHNHGVLMCVEVREEIGARAVNLSSQVRKYPGQIDVYRPTNSLRHECPVDDVATEMLRLTGGEYGYGSLFRASLQYVPIVRWFVDKDFGKPTPLAGPLDCSGTISNEFDRTGHITLVPNLPHYKVTPGDLGRCPMFSYEFTLTWEGVAA